MSKIIKQRERGSLIVVSGPSGCGKGTVIQEFLKNNKDAWLSISCTSRDPRPGDVPNESYFFFSRDEFLEKIDREEFLEYAEYNGNYYGTSIDSILDNCVIDLEPNGLKAFEEKIGDKIYSIFLDVSDEERLRRGIARGDDPEVIKSRIEEEKELFTDKVKLSVDFLIRDLKREEVDMVIENNIDVLFTK